MNRLLFLRLQEVPDHIIHQEPDKQMELRELEKR